MLHLFCGKMAAGKSTLARQLAVQDNAVLIIEDDWLSKLYGDQMKTPADYVTFSGKLREAITDHAVGLLQAGQSVVLDFAANTVAQRAWMRRIVEASEADHQLHVLIPPDAVCLERLRARNASGEHPFAPTEEQFHQFSRHFQQPTPDEGFALVIHDGA